MNNSKGTESATAAFLKGNNEILNKSTKRAPAPEINSKTEDIGKVNFSNNYFSVHAD